MDEDFQSVFQQARRGIDGFEGNAKRATGVVVVTGFWDE